MGQVWQSKWPPRCRSHSSNSFEHASEPAKASWIQTFMSYTFLVHISCVLLQCFFIGFVPSSTSFLTSSPTNPLDHIYHMQPPFGWSLLAVFVDRVRSVRWAPVHASIKVLDLLLKLPDSSITRRRCTERASSGRDALVESERGDLSERALDRIQLSV